MSSPNGPHAGSTPTDSDELSGNPSPWHTGEALGNVSDVAPSTYPAVPNGVPGYYNHPAADPDNPYHAGSGSYTAGERAAANVVNLNDDVYAPNLGMGIKPDAGDPDTDPEVVPYHVDTGQADQLVPKDRRR